MSSPADRVPGAASGEPRGTPWLVWLLMLLYCIGAAHASFNIDTARDLAHALDIASGAQMHLSGPQIGSSFRLGPLWYYLLAAPLALGLPVSAMGWFTGALAALQFWLAWRLGLSIRDRRLGLCLALALSLPSWTRMYWLASAHTILTVPAILATLLAWMTYWNSPSARMALAGGLCIGIALHGHPSTLPLVTLLALTLLRPAGGRRALPLLCGALGCALLFVPAGLDQAMSGWSDVQRTTHYLAQQDVLANLRHAPRVLWNIVANGAPAAAEISLGAHPVLRALAAAIAWTGLITGAAGLAWSQRARRLRAAIGVATALAALNVLIVSSARDYVTYYSVDLATTLIALIAGAGWYGLALLRRPPLLDRRVASALVGVVVVLNAGLLAGWLLQVRAGRLTAPIDAGLNLQKRTPLASSTVAPAVFLKDLGYLEAQVCGRPQPVVHGDGAVFLDLTGEVLRRSGCADATTVQLGGRAQPGAPDLAALGCEIIRDTSTKPVNVQGDLCWLPVARNLNPGPGVPAADSRIYLPHRHESGAKTVTTEGTLAGRETVVLTITRPDWVEFTTPVMSIDGKASAPFYANGRTFAWRNPEPAATPRAFVLRLTAANPDAVDVFVLATD